MTGVLLSREHLPLALAMKVFLAGETRNGPAGAKAIGGRGVTKGPRRRSMSPSAARNRSCTRAVASATRAEPSSSSICCAFRRGGGVGVRSRAAVALTAPCGVKVREPVMTETVEFRAVRRLTIATR